MGVDPYTGGAKTTESPEKTPGKNLVTKGAGQDARSTRKSCDSCHFQKKKCDGDGTSRCKCVPLADNLCGHAQGPQGRLPAAQSLLFSSAVIDYYFRGRRVGVGLYGVVCTCICMV